MVPYRKDPAAEDLRLVSKCKGYGRIEEALATSSQSAIDSAHCEIFTAAEFLRQGLEVIFLPKRKKQRSPDLRVAEGDKISFVEVTQLDASGFRKRAIAETRKWRLPDLHGVDLKVSVRRFISKPHRNELKAKIVRLASQVSRSGTPETLDYPDLINVLVKPAERERPQVNVVGPVFNFAEVERLRTKIERKVVQLPPNAAGMLVIFDNSTVPYQFEEPDYRPIIFDLEETVFDYPHLTGVIIAVDLGAAQHVGSSRSGPHWSTRRRAILDSHIQDVILIQNRYSDYDVIPRIPRAFGL